MKTQDKQIEEKDEMKISKKDVDSINKIRIELYSNFSNVPCYKRLRLPKSGGILTKKAKRSIYKRWGKRKTDLT